MADFQYNDGGRASAGYKGFASDCTTRAIAIACEIPYQEVYDMVNAEGQRERPRRGRKRGSARTGIKRTSIHRLMTRLGWTWTPTMGIGTGCQVHLRRDELPAGRLIVSLSRHVCAVIDGTIHDNYDPSRAGTRCVYGYWSKP